MLVEYKSDLITKFIPTGGTSKRWQLSAPFEFVADGIAYQVPAGFYTDFASVPRFLHPLLNPYELGCGPIPHDFGYFTGLMSQSYWDEVFAACMALDGISWWRRVAAYNAVRTFGGFVFRRYRQHNQKYALHLAASGSYEIEGWEREAVA